MSERGEGYNPEIITKKEFFNSKVNKVAEKLEEIKIFSNDPEDVDKVSDWLGKIFDEELKHGNANVNSINETINEKKKPEAERSKSQVQIENAEEDKAILVAAINKVVDKVGSINPSLVMEMFKGSAHINNMLPDDLKGLGKELSQTRIKSPKIDGLLNRLEASRNATDFNDDNQIETFTQRLDGMINSMNTMDIDPENEDELCIVLNVLNDEKKGLSEIIKKINFNDESEIGEIENKAIKNTQMVEEVEKSVDMRAVINNMYAKDQKEYVSPYEITEDYFVKMCFEYENPRMFPSTPPEWYKKLSTKEQYLIDIQQKLASGIGYKLGTKDISVEKARTNEIYNFPSKELKLIYEMYGVREAMQTFVGELFEMYTEDGRRFLRVKQSKNIMDVPEDERPDCVIGSDGYVINTKTNSTYIDGLTKLRFGNDFDDDCSLETYREEVYLRMAMKRANPDMSDDFIKNNWKKWSEDGIKSAINEYHKQGKHRKELNDNEIEYKWMVDNALEEKRAVAAAWNFLFVGNIVESADIYRQLKPTQANSDKIRTMMMPLEKFLQKLNVHKESLNRTEEFFGGSLALWARKKLIEDDKNGESEFRNKLRYAASHDRNKMTPEQAMWRIMPKRVMCSFVDMYKVKTKDKGMMTMSQALMDKEEIVMTGNDLDVFVYLRDTWDEIATVMPFLIGKGEYDPTKQIDKYASAVGKMEGLVNSIKDISLAKEGTENSDEPIGFGHQLFTNCPEYYAWLIANSVGIETDLDTPILKRQILNKDLHYYIAVEDIVNSLDLDSKATRIVKKILNAEGYLSSKKAIRDAEKRKAERGSRKIKEERK